MELPTRVGGCWHGLPEELKAIVLSHISDISTLLHLILADPSMAWEIKRSFNTLLRSALSDSMPPDMAVAILSIRQAGKFPNEELPRYFSPGAPSALEMDPVQHMSPIGDPIAALRTLARIQGDVEYFTWTFIKRRCQKPDVGQPSGAANYEEAPPSPTELCRIRRGLWRFQLCCELSNSWCSSSNIELVQSGENERTQRLKYFLTDLSQWELQELISVYDHISSVVYGNPKGSRLDVKADLIHPRDLFKGIETRFDLDRLYRTHGARAKLLSQGLDFLHTYIRGTNAECRSKTIDQLSIFEDQFILSALNPDSSRLFLARVRQTLPCSKRWPWPPSFGANHSNAGWDYFATVAQPTLCSFKYLRHFGLCMWDRQRLERWESFTRDYALELDRKLLSVWYAWMNDWDVY